MNAVEKIVARNWQNHAAFNAKAALYNLQQAMQCERNDWERQSYMAHAIVFQRKAESYAKGARAFMGLE